VVHENLRPEKSQEVQRVGSKRKKSEVAGGGGELPQVQAKRARKRRNRVNSSV